MRTSALLGATFILICADALAQSGGDALRACSLPSYAERMRCLEKLAGEATPASPASPEMAATPAPAPVPVPVPGAAPAPPSVPPPVAETPVTTPAPSVTTPAPSVTQSPSKWIVSETRSPVDYSPVAIATASSPAGANGVLQLSIQCRGGGTEMAIRTAPMMRRIEDHVVSYTINDAPAVRVMTGPSASGSGIALKGDVAGFLTMLPEEGVIAFRVADRQGATLEGRYDLPGMKSLVARMAGPCKWRRN